jgi:3-hydroxyisobutyrate dehydrogenase-like beta-hydroxyacid dehydrogenase
MAQPTIGCIGLGLMGTGLTKRLTAKGYRVIGYDVVPDKIAQAARHGVERARSPAEVARQAEVVLASVTTTADLEELIAGDNGIASAGRLDGRVFVDHSTSDIATTQRLACLLEERSGMAFIDAPVSGGPAAAEAGTLAIMAGGNAQAIAKVAPVMAHLGRFTHMGEVGAGQATKLVNQALVLTNYCVIAEALRLAEAYGIDAAKVPEALAPGHAGSNLLPVLFERMIARDFAPRGYARQVLKDLEMLNEAARAKHLALPMASQALTLFRLLNGQGKSELDGAAVVSLWPDATA